MPETTENYHRIPVGKKKKGGKVRTITLGKGIKALYDAKNKIILTYLFDVKKYSMKEARKWVKQHKSKAEIAQVIENLSLVKDIAELYRESKKEALDALR
ncbi:MAG: hypothetical protein ACXADW_13985 [Candidatus Hodarchaeales archaeon]|jgi:hypothetical protein